MIERFGKLFLVKRGKRWRDPCELLCDCGNTHRALYGNLYKGRTASCGCTNRQRNPNFRHGGSPASGAPPEYQIFAAAKQRCVNPRNHDYPNYGGRGIQFLFPSFASFIDCLGLRPSPDLTLDRIENEGNYERGNVRWATRLEQNNNRRPWTRRRLPS